MKPACRTARLTGWVSSFEVPRVAHALLVSVDGLWLDSEHLYHANAPISWPQWRPGWPAWPNGTAQLFDGGQVLQCGG